MTLPLERFIFSVILSLAGRTKEKFVDIVYGLSIRSSCCPDYTYVAGRCVPDDINPCSLNLCEQRCSVYFGRYGISNIFDR